MCMTHPCILKVGMGDPEVCGPMGERSQTLNWLAAALPTLSFQIPVVAVEEEEKGGPLGIEKPC